MHKRDDEWLQEFERQLKISGPGHLPESHIHHHTVADWWQHERRMARRIWRDLVNVFEYFHLTEKKVVRILQVSGVVCFVVLITQLIIPSTLATRKLQLDDIIYNSRDTGDIESAMREQAKTKIVSVSSGVDRLEVPLAAGGAVAQIEQSLVDARDYSIVERLIPFSIIHQVTTPASVQVEYTFDAERLKQLAEHIALQLDKPGLNAFVTYDDNGSASIVPEKSGKQHSVPQIMEALLSDSSYNNGIEVPYNVIEAERTNESLTNIVAQYNNLLTRKIPLRVNEQVVVPDQKTIASWTTITIPPSAQEQPTIDYKSDAIKAYVNDIAKSLTVDPTPTVVRRTLGTEIGRTLGKSGVGIDTEAMAATIISQLKDGTNVEKDIAVVTKPVPAPIIVKDEPLEADSLLGVIDLAVRSQRGTYGVAVKELNGQQRAAEYRGDVQFVTGSTYKLLLTQAVYQRTTLGEKHWSDVVVGGLTLDTCFERMLTVSDNYCAAAVGDFIDWRRADQELAKIGIINTKVYSYYHGYFEHKVSTAHDEMTYMEKIARGEIMDESFRSRILGYLKRQIYRGGIPTGATGSVVADKSGNVDEYYNDTAVVYGSKSTYVISIMSKNNMTWPALANITRMIHQYLQN